MTVELLKNFINATLLEQFPDKETKTSSEVEGEPDIITTEPNATLSSAVEVANQSYSALTARMPSKAVIRFDSQTFQLKTALCHVYEYVLQDKAILHNLSLQTMGLSEEQVFSNYFQLLRAEREELEQMRKEALDEIKDKEEDVKNMGAMLYHRYPRCPKGGRLW